MKIYFKSSRPYRVLLPTIFFMILTTFSYHHAKAIAKEKKLLTKHEKIQTGKASYYCQRFHGRKTASGKIFDRHQLVAAHPSYSMGTRVLVTNLENHKEVEVKIIDRGPKKSHHKKGIIIDLSRAAAEKLGMVRKGRALVRVEVLKWGYGRKIAEESDHDGEDTES